jgi:replicative DNA helicase
VPEIEVSKELQVINAVLKNKDIQTLFGPNIDDLMVGYADVWASIKGYHARYRAIPDIEVIQERFDDLERVEVKGDTSYYVDALKEDFIKNNMRRLSEAAGMKIRAGDTAPRVLADLQADLSKLNRFSNASRDLDVMDFDSAENHYDEVRARAEAMGGVPGVATGVDFIDSSYTSGLAGGDLVIVLGWTGRAKSLFTTLLACNAHKYGGKPMIVSLEMSGEKVRDRIYTIKGSGLFANSSLALGDIAKDDFRSFAKENAGKHEFIVVSNDGVGEMTPNIIQAKIDQHKPTMLIFDYAQLGSDNSNSQDMTARMRNMSKEFKALAVANNIPVVLISSATPDNPAAAKTPPTIEQVAWSKQLAYDADLAFAVHKHDDSDNVEIVCRKNRNGPLFSGYLVWDIDNGIIIEKADLDTQD